MIKTSTVVPVKCNRNLKVKDFLLSFNITRNAAHHSIISLYNGRDISNYLIQSLYFYRKKLIPRVIKLLSRQWNKALESRSPVSYTGALSASACIFIQVRQRRELKLTR